MPYLFGKVQARPAERASYLSIAQGEEASKQLAGLDLARQDYFFMHCNDGNDTGWKT